MSLRWPPEQDFSSVSLGELLEQLGAGTGLALAVMGHKAVLELPAARALRLMARAAELAEEGALSKEKSRRRGVSASSPSKRERCGGSTRRRSSSRA